MNALGVARLRATFTLAWLLALVISITLLFQQPLPIGARTVALVDMTLIAVLYIRLTLSRTGGQMAGVVVLAALVVPLVVLVPSAGMWWHVIYAVIAVGLLQPAPIAGAASVVLVVLAMLASRLVSGRIDPRLLIQLAIGGAAMAVRALTITVDQLRLAREELALRAVDAERLRIARDLHDLLGHSLSLVALKSELAAKLLPDSPEVAAREVRDIERAARHALREVRAVVTEYRRPTLRGELEAAAELLAASNIRLTVHTDAADLPPAADALFAWTVREGVTNVIRHSPASECVIRTFRSQAGCGVVIEDNGGGRTTPPNDGSGLRGIGERCEAVDARFAVVAEAGRFAISVTMPVRAVTADGSR